MKLSFHRSRWIEVLPQNGAAGPVRVFRVAVGVSAPVDPLSGMTVNLVEVDRWLADFASRAQGLMKSREQELQDVYEEFRVQAEKAQAKLVSFSWHEGDFIGEWREGAWWQGRDLDADRTDAQSRKWPGVVRQWRPLDLTQPNSSQHSWETAQITRSEWLSRDANTRFTQIF